MLAIEKVNTDNKAQVKRFVELPHRLYRRLSAMGAAALY